MANRGGFRFGAGRPRGSGKYGETTVPRRVPVSRVAEFDAWIKNSFTEEQRLRRVIRNAVSELETPNGSELIDIIQTMKDAIA